MLYQSSRPAIAKSGINRDEQTRENRPRSGNIQKLDHLELPRRHRHLINSVGSCDRRSFPGRVNSEDALDYTSVEKIGPNEGNKTYKKENIAVY